MGRLERATADFKKHTATVLDMKKDLDSIFKRIRNIKAKLAKQMPEAYNSVGVKEIQGEEDDEYDVMIRERKKAESAAAASTSSIDDSTNVVLEKEVEEATEKLL